jgi:subtilisin-like proprotein convertase family protein
MKKILLFVIFITSIATVSAQKDNAWQVYSDDQVVTSEKIRENPYAENQKLLQFNPIQFKQSLANVAELSSGQPGVEILLPNVNGALEKYLVWESSNFEPALQASFPDIRAYVGKGITDPTAVLNFSFSPYGVQTMVFRADSGSEFIEPYTKDRSVYIVFDSKTRVAGQMPFVCSSEDQAIHQQLQRNNNATFANNQVYKTMRLALSCTGEYGAYHGGTVAGALAAMNATMTRCNGIFERDLAVKLLIIANNNLVIYTNASTDPYSPASTGANGAWNGELQANLTSVIGDANYDIGHLFGASGGGGNAGCIGCVCDAGKGSGYTSPADGVPAGDTFDIDYVAHEMGHQMGANHTFTHTSENNSVNMEPGSGSTIMAYAGIGGGGTDMQSHSDDYFTYRSIFQIQSNLVSKTCPVSTSIVATNPRPTVSAGPSFTIPIGTAFKLTGTATGTPGEVLTYNWEQNNDATIVGGTSTFPSPTKTDGPNFRSVVPSSSLVRYMPAFQSVLNGQLTTTWETVSTVARTLNFSFTVRDNVLGGGQTNTGAMAVTVNASAGPFTLTSQSSSGINWTPGSTETITWNVANTTSLAGSANVNIKLSTDGGLNFDTILAANTPNDGSETITVPSTASINCRILIEPTDNIYYAVNSRVFAIGAVCNTFSTTPNAAIADGTGTNVAGAVTTSVINVPTAINISNMKVNLKINHPRIGDLVVRIQHPDGTFRTLWSRNCNSVFYNGLDVTFADGTGTITCGNPTSGTYQSFQTLSGYNNKSSLGNWTLTVTDNNINNTGTLVSWGVDFGCTLDNESFEMSDVTVYPNPNNGNFTINYDNPISDEIKVDVFDIRGRKIFENTYTNQATFNESIQLNNAESGIYLLRVTDGNRKMVKRIAVE